MADETKRILYLGPGGGDTHDASSTEQQSRAARQYGAEFVQYSGSSEGELIEALKDADCAINQGHDFEPSMFAPYGQQRSMQRLGLVRAWLRRYGPRIRFRQRRGSFKHSFVRN